MSGAQTFGEFMAGVDRFLIGLIGLGHLDIPDANWRDYYESEMSVQEAAAQALYDYGDMPEDLLDDLGLGEYL
jgi:hypothetical protein